jgi:hypothetical protein
VDKYTNGRGTAILPPPTTQTITGRSLVHRQLDARRRAVLAASVLVGEVVFTPSAKQLADLFGVSIPYIKIAQKLSSGKRAAILRGWDSTPFTGLVNPPKQLSLAGPVIPDLKVIPDIVLENLIRSAGIERVLEAAVQVEATA